MERSKKQDEWLQSEIYVPLISWKAPWDNAYLPFEWDICMAMGEAVGIAAAMCAASDVKPRDLDVKILQKKLTDLGIDLFSE